MFATRLTATLAAAMLATTLTACGGGDDEPEPLPPMMSAEVDGISHATDQVNSTWASPTPTTEDELFTSIDGVVEQSATTALGWRIELVGQPAVGAYRCSAPSLSHANVYYFDDLRKYAATGEWVINWPTSFFASDCTVTIESVEGDVVTGSFSATLENRDGSSVKTITNGTFRVPKTGETLLVSPS